MEINENTVKNFSKFFELSTLCGIDGEKKVMEELRERTKLVQGDERKAIKEALEEIEKQIYGSGTLGSIWKQSLDKPGK